MIKKLIVHIKLQVLWRPCHTNLITPLVQFPVLSREKTATAPLKKCTRPREQIQSHIFPREQVEVVAHGIILLHLTLCSPTLFYVRFHMCESMDTYQFLLVYSTIFGPAPYGTIHQFHIARAGPLNNLSKTRIKKTSDGRQRVLKRNLGVIWIKSTSWSTACTAYIDAKMFIFSINREAEDALRSDYIYFIYSELKWELLTFKWTWFPLWVMTCQRIWKLIF